MNNSINDVFENMQKESKSRGLKYDALYTILAARVCLEEFIVVCDECTLVSSQCDDCPDMLVHLVGAHFLCDLCYATMYTGVQL
jgi:hypothetical protein